MQDPISGLFVGNPDLEDRLEEFLNQNPAYVQGRQKVLDLERKLMDQMPPELRPLFLRYEKTVNRVQYIREDGFYLFGLGLRQDLRESLRAGLL